MGLHLMGWYQLGLWECLGDTALDGAVTTACAYPARDTGPCDPAHHHEHRPRNPAALAEGGRGQRGWEAVAKCSHVYRVFVGAALRRGGQQHSYRPTTEALSTSAPCGEGLDKAPRFFLNAPMRLVGGLRHGGEEANICGAMVSLWPQC